MTGRNREMTVVLHERKEKDEFSFGFPSTAEARKSRENCKSSIVG